MNLFPENTIVENPSLELDSDFRSIVDISPYPIFIHKDGIVKYANQLTKKLIGEDDDVIGFNIADYIHADDRTRLGEVIQKAHTTRISDLLGFRVVDRYGNTKHIESKSTGINFGGEQCRLVHVYNIERINFGTLQDITEVKANQSELINYRAFQEKINATSPVLVTIFDIAQMTSVYRSQDIAQWFNYPPERIPDRTIDLIHPDYKEDAITSIMGVTTLQDGEIQTTVYPFVTGDGNVRFLLSRSTVFQRDENGHVTHILMAHSDITDLKETESKLDKSEETRKAIIYAIPDMVITARADGMITDFYPNGLNGLELEQVDFPGKNVKDILSKKYYTPILELVSETIKHKKLHTYSFEQVHPERTYTYELRISPFSDDEVIVLIRDISDQKDNQNKIDHYNKELFEKNQELERYITSNSELEKFAYIASHDLREPLRSLTGFAQLLQKRNQGVISQESVDFIDNIIQGAQRMNTLISGLLEYSRIASVGKPFTTVNTADLIKKVRSDLKIAIEENNTELIVFDMPELYCDELQVRQLFQNLISNAIKFRSDRTPIIKISAEKTDRHWLFKIEDNGIGIDMRYKDLVFQIFSRLHAQDKYQGSGIGLSVCKKILERHGGQIWLESTPGRGTTIFFTILI